MRHYNAKARISRIRVWVCPVVAKAYLRRDATGHILQDHNLVHAVSVAFMLVSLLTKLGTSFGSTRPDNLPSVPMYPSTKNFPPPWHVMVAYITISPHLYNNRCPLGYSQSFSLDRSSSCGPQSSQRRRSLDALHHLSAYLSTRRSNGLDSPARGSLPIH